MSTPYPPARRGVQRESLTGTLLSRIGTPSGTQFVSTLDVAYYLLAGVKSHYLTFTGREYDFGPGLGLNFNASLRRDSWDVLSLALRQAWVNAANGNDVEHSLTYTSVRAQVPVRDFFGVGAEYILYLAEGDYEDFDDVSTRYPELRLFLVWSD